MAQGGTNVILAVIMILAAVRAVEATYKLRGRFAESSSQVVS
jgi:cell division protein FtsL